LHIRNLQSIANLRESKRWGDLRQRRRLTNLL
jgi:hypothetical protein